MDEIALLASVASPLILSRDHAIAAAIASAVALLRQRRWQLLPAFLSFPLVPFTPILSAALAAISLALDYFVPLTSLPTPYGPYHVGAIDHHIPAGLEDLHAPPPPLDAVLDPAAAPHVSHFSGLNIRYYYPTDVNDGDFMPWSPSTAHSRALLAFGRIPPPLLFLLDHTPLARTAARHGAPLSQRTRPKLLIFSHGLGGTRAVYAALCCELASVGFFVAAVEHSDGTASLTELPKRSVAYDRAPPNNWKPKRRAQLARRAQEIRWVLKKVESDGAALPQGFRADDIDLTAPVIAGHSFGGATAVVAAKFLGGFSTLLSFDPWLECFDPSWLDEVSTFDFLFINMLSIPPPPHHPLWQPPLCPMPPSKAHPPPPRAAAPLPLVRRSL
jgi:hypothetical protein